jgi:hypothetical protein
VVGRGQYPVSALENDREIAVKRGNHARPTFWTRAAQIATQRRFVGPNQYTLEPEDPMVTGQPTPPMVFGNVNANGRLCQLPYR